MKVLMITPAFLPTRGGAERLVFELALGLKKRGLEPVVVAENHGAKKDETISGIPTYRCFTLNNTAGIVPTQFSSFFLMNKIGKDCDLVHQFYFYRMSPAVWLFSRLFGKPRIVSLIGWDSYDPIVKIPKVLNPYLGWAMNTADKITAVSKIMTKYAKEQGCRKDIEVIYNWVDLEKFTPEKADKTKIFPKYADKIIVFSCQRLDPRKKIEVTIKAAEIVQAKNPKVQFVIAGKGPEKEKLENLVKERNIKNVEFAGFVPEEQLPEYYASCDIFGFHSLYEAFGIVLAEAMAAGKPVISTKVGAIPEVVEDGKTGLLVEPNNPEQMAEAILKLAKNKELREKMGKAGRKKAEEQFDWDKIVDRYVKIYEELLNKKEEKK